jgi:RNA polymerase sigma-70 factor (sigma-E family)
MRVRAAEVSFEDFVRARSRSLMRMALLLAGQNRAEAEDLLQLALERAYRHWPRICRLDEPERYVRRVLANASVDRHRWTARRQEQPLSAGAAELAVADGSAVVAERDYLLRALAALPRGQRAVLVLRYFEDLSEAEIAQVLGCSVGSVKNQAARGLARLRNAAGAPPSADPERGLGPVSQGEAR